MCKINGNIACDCLKPVKKAFVAATQTDTQPYESVS